VDVNCLSNVPFSVTESHDKINATKCTKNKYFELRIIIRTGDGYGGKKEVIINGFSTKTRVQT
jgi:hypothetical protein